MHTARYFIFLLFATISIVSCEKRDIETSGFALKINSEAKDIDEIRLTGYLADGTRSIIGRGAPSSNGYTVYINDPLHPIYLYNIKGVPDDHQHFHFSNPEVLCYNAVYFFDAYKNNQYVGTFSHVNYITFDGTEEIKEAQWIKYIYVTDDVSITGTHLVDGVPYHTYDLHLKKGWNTYAQIDYREKTEGGYTNSLFTSDIPTGTKWNLRIIGSH